MRVLDVLGFSPKKIQSKFRTDKDGGMTFVLYTPHACLEECECKFALSCNAGGLAGLTSYDAILGADWDQEKTY